MTKKHGEWNKDTTAKSVQVAFELEQQIARSLQVSAAQEGLTPSNQIRKLIGLSYTPPKRPRLTLSLSEHDYQWLGEKYGLDAEDAIAIKREIMQELIAHFSG